MKTYIYETEHLPYNSFTGKTNADYLEIINKRGADGWKFVAFLPVKFKPKGVKGSELIFEKAVEEKPFSNLDKLIP